MSCFQCRGSFTGVKRGWGWGTSRCPTPQVPRLAASSGRQRLFHEENLTGDCEPNDSALRPLPQDRPAACPQSPAHASPSQAPACIRSPGRQAGAPSSSQRQHATQYLQQQQPLQHNREVAAVQTAVTIEPSSAAAAAIWVTADAAAVPRAGRTARRADADVSTARAAGPADAATTVLELLLSDPSSSRGGAEEHGQMEAVAAGGRDPQMGQERGAPRAQRGRMARGGIRAAVAGRYGGRQRTTLGSSGGGGGGAPTPTPAAAAEVHDTQRRTAIAARAAGLAVAAGTGSAAPRAIPRPAVAEFPAPAPVPAPAPASAPVPAAGGDAPVHVFWDLDNKYPETLDHEGLVGRMRELLQPYGRVVEIRAYGNYQTLNFVPDIWEEALLRLPEAEDDGGRQPRCPVCGARFRDDLKLRSHFRQLHGREHAKRLAHPPAAQRYAHSSQLARFKAAEREVLARRRGYDLEGILRGLGVDVRAVPVGPQRADVQLQSDAAALLRLWSEEYGRAGSVAAPGTKAAMPPAASITASTAASTCGMPVGDVATAAAGSTERSRPSSRPVLALVSDDRGFEPLLKLFVAAGWETVSVSRTKFRNARARVPWLSVARP